ncbi:MAG: hypothetical protein AABZ31_02090 [Bdellovibrionota bacterium]
MKTKIFLGRIFLSLFFTTAVGCSDVQFAPLPGAPIVYNSGAELTDEFLQGYLGKKLDILFIVDNSGSMAEEQMKLGVRIQSFLSTLYDIDWQIGVTTTDVSDGPYGIKGSLLNIAGQQSYILNAKTPDYQNAFQATVVRSETNNCGNSCPSGDEQALMAAMMAIEKRNTDNKGFFRNGADLGILVLSDEDEKSEGTAADAARPADVLKLINSVWQDSKSLFTYGMIIRPDDKACMDANNGQGHYGTFVAELSRLTHGLVGSICDNDYAPTLGLLGDNARKLTEYVELRTYPDPSTILIEYSVPHVSTYRLEGRRIYFDMPPEKGTKITVSYKVM